MAQPAKQKIEVAARALAEGNSQSDAYREAYPRSLKWKNETVHVKASVFFDLDMVKERVAELMAETLKEHDITKERVLGELASQAFTHIGNIVSWDGEGNVQITPSDEIRPEHLAAVKEVTATETVLSTNSKTGEQVLSRRLNIKMHNKNNALNILSRFTKIVEEAGLTIDNRSVIIVPQTAPSIEGWAKDAQQWLETNENKQEVA